jgi:methyl-accepting chemotaxis protein
MINSLRHRLVFFVLLVVTVLAAVLTTVAYQHTYAAAEAGVRQNIAATTANKVAFINEWVHSRQRVVGSVLPRFGHGELKPVLDQALEAGGFDDMYVGQPDKTMTQFSKATLVPAGYDPTVRPWYVAAAATEGSIASPPYIDASTKQPIITFAQGLRRNGQLVAVAGGDVTLKRVVEEVTAAQLPGNGYAFLITQDGAVIAHPAADSALKKISEVVPGLTPDSVPRDGAIHNTTLNSVKYFMVLQPVGKTGWLMGALVPHDAALAPVQHMLYSTMQSDQLSSDKRWIGTLRKQLQGAEVEIVAQLGSGKISLGQILKLKVGDVIPLNIPEKIEALVDSVPLMECTYGQQNGQYALKVERFIAAPPEAPAVPPATGDKNG